MSTLEETRNQINNIDQQIKENSAQTRMKVKEVKENSDFTNAAKQQKIQHFDRDRDKNYTELQKEKAGIVNDTMKKLSERLYKGKSSNPIAFDNAVHSFVNSDEKELVNRLKQNPSEETKRAIYKASVVSENPKFEVLAKASDLYPDDKESISDYFEFQQQYGKLEDRTSKFERRLFGEQV